MQKLVLAAALLACLALTPGAAGAEENGGSHKEQKVLIIYFSHSGNTKIAAERLREKTGGDIYAIETVRTYPEVYRNLTEEAKRELEAHDLPELKGPPPDLAPYDLILVGGPVWWYTVSTPLMKFLEQTDFQGKRVAVFCTHGGGTGHYLEDFKTQAKNAVVLDCLYLWGSEAGSRNTSRTLDNWLTKLEKE